MLDKDINFRNTPDFIIEKATNWQLKTSCIREVLPRVYLELALVNCKRFMNKRLNVSDLDRLGYMVRGIAEPLSASYIGAYLCRVGNEIDPKAKDYIMNILQSSYKHWEFAIEHGHPSLDAREYFDLFAPSIDFIYYCAGNGATEDQFKNIIKQYNQNKKQMVFLNGIITYYPPEYVCKYAEDILAEILGFNLTDKLCLIKSLGISLIKSKPRKPALKLKFLNFGWE